MQGVLLGVLLVVGTHAVCGAGSNLLNSTLGGFEPFDVLDALVKYLKNQTDDNSIGGGSEKSKMSTGDIITMHGYPQERHTVVTPDGYVLTVFRLPNPGKPCVMVLHGIQSSSTDFVLIGPQLGALAYLLFDAGYDVWLANQRGNFYGLSNVNLSTESDEFWRFSFHEIGTIDSAATVDYILQETGQANLAFVAHSQGTTAFFALASTKPEYNEKIHTMVALAPVVFLEHLASPLFRTLAENFDLVKATFDVLDAVKLTLNRPTRAILSNFCSIPGKPQSLCIFLLMKLIAGGYDPINFNKSLLGDIYAHVPAGGSVQQILHYGQIFKSNKFCQYDYGVKNSQYYNGSSTAPCYNMSQITTKVHLIYGLNDDIARRKDVRRLAKLLSNVDLRQLPYPGYNHINYLWGMNNWELVFSDVIARINDGLEKTAS